MGVFRVGLTGGIGSGKSTVAALLARHGAAVIDTDAIARHLASSGGAAHRGDSRCVRWRNSLTRLERWTEPACARWRFRTPPHDNAWNPYFTPSSASKPRDKQRRPPRRCWSSTYPCSLNRQSGGPRVDRVLVVDCSAPSQIERVMARSAWTHGAVEAVIAQQAKRSTRRAMADAVIFNDGIGLEELISHVQALASFLVPETRLSRAGVAASRQRHNRSPLAGAASAQCHHGVGSAALIPAR